MGEIKPSFNQNRQTLGKIMPLDTPFTVIIDSSERCNFRCSYCFRSDDDKSLWGYAADNNNMSREVFEKVLLQLKDFPSDIKMISLSNHGEPLCNPDLPWMITRIKEEGFNSVISLHTNGSLLKGDMLEKMIEADPGKIVISLQGLSDESYKKTCGANISFDSLVENISSFYSRKKTTLLCVKIMNVALNPGEEQRFYDIFTPIADRVFVEQEVDIWKNKDLGTKSDTLIYNKYGEGFCAQKTCPVLFHTLVITTVGDVYPCTQLFGHESLGNINDIPVVEMWDGKKRTDMLLDQLDPLSDPAPCRECGIKQNSIFAKEDELDPYRDDIRKRILEK